MNEQITSAAELDALPVGSVVMEGDSGEPFEWVVPGVQVMPGVFHRFPDGWYVVSGNGQRDPLFGLGFLTVLYRPDQPQRVQSSREDVARALYNSDHSYQGMTEAVLALFAQRPTVAEVARKAWARGYSDAMGDYERGDPLPPNPYGESEADS